MYRFFVCLFVSRFSHIHTLIFIAYRLILWRLNYFTITIIYYIETTIFITFYYTLIQSLELIFFLFFFWEEARHIFRFLFCFVLHYVQIGENIVNSKFDPYFLVCVGVCVCVIKSREYFCLSVKHCTVASWFRYFTQADGINQNFSELYSLICVCLCGCCFFSLCVDACSYTRMG